MTNRFSLSNRPEPASGLGAVLGGGLAFAVLVAASTGCGGGEPEVQAVKRTAPARSAPPPPPEPTVTPVARLMTQLSIDDRVSLPEDQAPDNDADRIAVLEFFDAFARADGDTLGTMMSSLDRQELTLLAATPAWNETISDVVEIGIETGAGPYGEKCALAIFYVDDHIQPQLWYYKVNGDEVQFEAAASPPHVEDKLYGDDWISRWHELLEEEIALANQLDLEMETAPVILGESSGGGSTAPPPGQPARSPGKPGFTPGSPGGKPDRRPTGKKRKPPGAR